jgi:hypothetical protein
MALAEDLQLALGRWEIATGQVVSNQIQHALGFGITVARRAHVLAERLQRSQCVLQLARRGCLSLWRWQQRHGQRAHCHGPANHLRRRHRSAGPGVTFA